MKTLNSGQSMFEVVIAIFIIAMIMVGIVSISTNSLSNAIFSRNKTLAGKYSQEVVEWLRSEREKDSQIFITKAVGNYCLDNTTLSWSNTEICAESEKIQGTIFTRNLSFTTSQIDNKSIIEATATTFWNDSRGYHEAKSITNFSDIREK